jgi:hypothetical protein
MSDLDKKIIRRRLEYDNGEGAYFVTEYYRDGTNSGRRLASEGEAKEYRDTLRELDGMPDNLG